MASISMDLTGSDENCLVSNQIYKIFKYGQMIDFETPIYKDSLKVYYASGGLSGQEMSLDTDFIIPDEFVSSCDNDLSAARLRNPAFRADLISGIEMIRPVSEDGSDFQIAVTYQRLYPLQIVQTYSENTPINFTPELLREILNKLAIHENLLNRVTDVTAIGSDSVIYEVDTTGTKAANKITDEEHAVSTANGRFIIHPKAGSFYANSLSITYNGVPLVLNQDYYLVGMDEAATKATSNVASAVWHFAAIVTPVEGTVKISYQAFGGIPTIDNYRHLLENITSVISYLNDAQTLTESSIGDTKIMKSVCSRVYTLEEKMRRLHGGVNYGDVTDGKTILMKVRATEEGVNWFTFAKLYLAGGSTVATTADTITFKLQALHSHFQFTCFVAVDLQNQDGDKFNCQVSVDNYPRGYTSFKDYSSVDDIIRPQLRVIYNEQESASGAYLQIGFDLKTMNQETFEISDISGQEGEWLLVDEVDTLTYPQNDNVVLPDGVSTWSTFNDASRSESMLIPFTKGHLIWFGEQVLNRTTNGWQHVRLTDLVISSSENITLSRLKKLRLNIEEEEGLQFSVDIPFAGGTDSPKGHATFTHQDQPAYINATIHNVDDTLTIDLNFDVIAGLESNKLTVKDMVIFL